MSAQDNIKYTPVGQQEAQPVYGQPPVAGYPPAPYPDPALQGGYAPQQPPYGYQPQPYGVPYAQPPVVGYPPVVDGGHQVIVVHNEEHHHEDNTCLGCGMGFCFGLIGLSCLLCVNNHRTYVRGWSIGFIIACIITGITYAILASQQ